MAILKITVEDDQTDQLRNLLQGGSFIKNIEEEHPSKTNQIEPEPPYQKIKRLLEEASGKNLFKDINPSAWQRAIRKEWDRDF
jgi:hypothetical protein